MVVLGFEIKCYFAMFFMHNAHDLCNQYFSHSDRFIFLFAGSHLFIIFIY